MGRRTATALLVALLLALGLPACGSADDSTSPGESAGAAPPGSEAARADGGAARPGGGAAGAGDVTLKKVGQFSQPVYVTGAPGYPRLLFVVEQQGTVKVLRSGRRAGTFLDIRSQVSFEGERGLLSIAFPPDYPRSRHFYVYYTDKRGNIRVDEFKRASATRAAPGSQRSVIVIPHPVNSNHNGGQLQFQGDLLYFGSGDGGAGGDPPNNAQNLNSLLGKLLRIDPRPSGGRPYSVPSSNPFVGRPGRDEIYAYGLRNPFRFSFDTGSAGTPRLAIGDVGQDEFEEVDYLPLGRAAGANFGWDAFEGTHKYTGAESGTPDPGGTTKPIFAYPHSRGGGSCSITGGYVVRDKSLRSLYRRYVYADFCEGQLRSLVPHLRRASDDRKLGLSVPSPSSFGEDDRGHLYVASLEGPVYRLIGR